MARENIYQELEVYYEKVDSCPLRDRQFNFFELVYIISGKGNHTVNDNTIPFLAGDLFLITPKDKHEFDLSDICEFMVIRFGENYIREYQWKSIDHMECLLYYASHLAGSVLVNVGDKAMVSSLIVNLQQITSHDSLYTEDLLRHLVNAILVIAARNIAIIKPQNLDQHTDVRILQILDYIQEHIRNPECLKIAVIAEKFGLSATYLGSYFRKQCKESLQQYIAAYRLRLIEHRLRFSDKRVNEIAHEFGFTDESHINKFFKKQHGVSLKTFRNHRISFSGN